jgi:hypothetical protein
MSFSCVLLLQLLWHLPSEEGQMEEEETVSISVLCCLQVEEIAQLRSSLRRAEWELQYNVSVSMKKTTTCD